MVSTVERILRENRVVAVIGARDDVSKAGFYVPAYLQGQGYRVLGVNPRLAGAVLWGEPVVATVAELGEPVDVVNVYRRSVNVAEHTEEVLAMRPLPRVVWLQLGIRNEEAAARWAAAGIEVVEDRCMLADHRRLGLGAPVQR